MKVFTLFFGMNCPNEFNRSATAHSRIFNLNWDNNKLISLTVNPRNILLLIQRNIKELLKSESALIRLIFYFFENHWHPAFKSKLKSIITRKYPKWKPVFGIYQIFQLLTGLCYLISIKFLDVKMMKMLLKASEIDTLDYY